MNVPEFWSESKQQFRVNGKSRTLRRFGWSDVSDDDALQKAQVRANTSRLSEKDQDRLIASVCERFCKSESGLPIA